MLFIFGVISVETGLDEIKAHLEKAGYTVVDMSEAPGAVEAVIYTGPESGCAEPGISSCKELYTVMINAAGLTPEEVAAKLAFRLNERNVQDLSLS
ncbi:MAG: YkuS family protein [Negativicutes bacterium]|nr:YkuS family protein [Negativicutes bacterium]